MIYGDADSELYCTISPAALAMARTMIRQGHPLNVAARAIGVLARDLDLALWRSIGGQVSLGPSYWSQFA